MFVPLITQSLSSQPTTVGLVVATYQAVLFLSSALFGRLADLKGYKPMIVSGLFAGAITLFAHQFVNDVAALFLVRALCGLAVGIFPAAMVAYASHQTRELGRFTSAGSLGWGIGSLVAGTVGDYNHVFTLSAGVSLVGGLVALVMLRSSQERIRQPFFNAATLKRNWQVYLSFFLRHAGAMGIWAIFPIYLERLGASKLWIGIIYGINAFGQALFMPLLDRLSARRLIRLGLYGSILTFVGFALCRNYQQLIPFQVLLAFSWSGLYLGSLKYLVDRNQERSTAAGLLNSTLSLSGITGAVLGGIVAHLGLPAVMLAAALMSAAGALVFRI